jgi:hypothetical protein
MNGNRSCFASSPRFGDLWVYRAGGRRNAQKAMQPQT